MAIALYVENKDTGGNSSAPKSPPLNLGAVLTDSKTAEGEVEAIDKRLFARSRGWLEKWREVHIDMFGSNDVALECIPSAKGLNWHRLAGGGGLMSDACAQAQKMSRVMAEKVKTSYVEKIGAEAWGALTEEEQFAVVRVYIVFCINHLRSTGARRAIKFEEKHLKIKFEDNIKEIPAHLRVHGKLTDALRAVAKEFVYAAIRIYPKGSGMYFFSWVVKFYPRRVIFALKRIDLGVRFDVEFEAALSVYMNLTLYMKFLKVVIDTKDVDNILERNLFITLGSLEAQAALRARAIFFLKVIFPLRFISNSSDLASSPVDMAKPLTTLYEFLANAANDGSLFMDGSLDIFLSSLDGTAREMYGDFNASFQRIKGTRADGSGKVEVYSVIMEELFKPMAESEALKAETIAVLEVHSAGFMEAMSDTPMRDYTPGGQYSEEVVTDKMRADMKGQGINNDPVSPSSRSPRTCSKEVQTSTSTPRMGWRPPASTTRSPRPLGL